MADGEGPPADPLAPFRAPDGTLPAYVERAYALYEASSYYLAQAQEVDAVQAAALTCEHFGHDAPRGLCLRCGLGTDVTGGRERDRQEVRDRLTQRDAWLKTRGG